MIFEQFEFLLDLDVLNVCRDVPQYGINQRRADRGSINPDQADLKGNVCTPFN